MYTTGARRGRKEGKVNAVVCYDGHARAQILSLAGGEQAKEQERKQVYAVVKKLSFALYGHPDGWIPIERAEKDVLARESAKPLRQLAWAPVLLADTLPQGTSFHSMLFLLPLYALSSPSLCSRLPLYGLSLSSLFFLPFSLSLCVCVCVCVCMCVCHPLGTLFIMVDPQLPLLFSCSNIHDCINGYYCENDL